MKLETQALHAGFNDDPCSGSMIPDTKIGGNLTIKEVFNDKKTTSIIHSRVQA